MKTTIYKVVYDTDFGTGCDLFTNKEDAVANLLAHYCAAGYPAEGDNYDDLEKMEAWREDCYRGIDTFFLDQEDIDITHPEQTLVPAGDFPDGNDYEFFVEREGYQEFFVNRDANAPAQSAWVKVGDRSVYLLAHPAYNNLMIEVTDHGGEFDGEGESISTHLYNK